MAIKVNLLPGELSVGKDLLKILRVTRMLGVIALALFIVSGLGLGAFFVFSSIQLSGINSANDSLKTQISAQETTETQVVLLKDRLDKIKTVQNAPSSLKILGNVNSLISTLSGASSVNELDITPLKVTTSVNFQSTADLTGFLTNLSSSGLFKTVDMTSFSFNPASGYLVALTITGK